MTIMTIAAAIMMGILISAWQGTASLGVQADNTAQSMQTEQLMDDYEQYNGSTLSGGEVRNFLSIYRNAEEEIVVLNDDGSESYNSQNSNFDNAYSATGHYVSEDSGERSDCYINPTKMYICSFEMNPNGSINKIVFTPKEA